MASGVVTWSTTAATNATADSTVNWAEGQAPSSVNDSARALMASVAKYRDDQAGTLTTGGTSTAYTLTSNQVFASLAAMSGMSLRVKFNATNGASPTLNVDGLGAKNIVTVTGTAVGTGSIRANQIYSLVYANGSSEWIMANGPPAIEAFPSGTLMLFQQTSAPTGWTKGATHNDKALRVVTGAAGTGGSTAFTSIFASRTLLKANLPSYNLDITGLTGTINTDSTGGGAGGAAALGANGTALATASVSFGGTIPLGGSATALDFAVAYVDLILAAKD